MADGPGLRVVSDVACTVCGCLCDDLRLTVEAGRIVRAEGACHLAEPSLLAQGTRRRPAATVEGRPVPVEEAAARAVDILRAARAPLIYGLSRSSTDGQRAATALADRLGATIDTTASIGHAPSVMALQQAGESTCTLGEVRNRADLVVYWGADPLATHPRHMERYAVDPPGEFVPGGRAGRTVILVDETPGSSAGAADQFIALPRRLNFEALWALRLLIRGVEPAADDDLTHFLPPLRDLAGRMTSCRFGIVFFGWGLSRTGVGHRTVEALLRLVTDLNAFTRFYARRMRNIGDVTGADLVLAWQTGYPFSVNFARGYPRYNPGEFSAVDLLERGEVDACLLVGSETVPRFGPEALLRLRAIPTVVLDVALTDPPFEPTVRFTVDAYGVQRGGTAYRMDEVPIPLRPSLPSEYASDEEIVTDLLARLGPAVSAGSPVRRMDETTAPRRGD